MPPPRFRSPAPDVAAEVKQVLDVVHDGLHARSDCGRVEVHIHANRCRGWRRRGHLRGFTCARSRGREGKPHHDAAGSATSGIRCAYIAEVAPLRRESLRRCVQCSPRGRSHGSVSVTYGDAAAVQPPGIRIREVAETPRRPRREGDDRYCARRPAARAAAVQWCVYRCAVGKTRRGR